jgi:hypothetical protein
MVSAAIRMALRLTLLDGVLLVIIVLRLSQAKGCQRPHLLRSADICEEEVPFLVAAIRGPPRESEPSGLDSGLRYQEVRSDCQDQDYRHGDDDPSGHTAQPPVCSGPKQQPDDDSREQREEDACANQRRTNRQQVRRAQSSHAGRAGPTWQDRLRHPEHEQAQKDDATCDYS